MVADSPASSLSYRNSSTGPIGQLTGSTAWAKPQNSKTLHLEEYNFLVVGALALAGRLEIKPCGLGWAILTASRFWIEGARSCPEAERAGPAWSESPRGADIEEESAPRTTSGMARTATSIRQTPLSFTLYRTAGISLTGRNTYSLLSGQGWASASMPRGSGELKENQSGDWNESCDAKRSTSALPNKSQIWTTVWWFNIHSPDLSFCLDRKSAARFKTPGTWTALKERNLSWDQRRRRHACLFRVRDREPPWRFIWDTTAMLSVLKITWHPLRKGRKLISARKTALSSRQFMCQERNSPVLEDRAPACQGCIHRNHLAMVNRAHSDFTLDKKEASPYWKGAKATLRHTD